jgi:hypothetical protein
MTIQKYIADHIDLLFQIVEDEEGIGDHEKTSVKVQVLREEIWDPLERFDHIIVDISDCPSKESREMVIFDRSEASQKNLQGPERIFLLSLLENLSILNDFELASFASKEIRRRRAQEAVAAPFLPSLHTFEKEGKLSIVDFPEC